MAGKGVVREGDKESIHDVPESDTMDQIEPPGPDAYDSEYKVQYYSTEPIEERISLEPGSGGGAKTVFVNGKGVTLAGQKGHNRTTIFYDRKWDLGPYPWPPGKEPTAKVDAEIKVLQDKISDYQRQISEINQDQSLDPETKQQRISAIQESIKSVNDQIKEKNEEKKEKEKETEHIKWVTGSFSDTETSRKEYELTSIQGSSTVFAEGQPVSRLYDKNKAGLIVYDDEDEEGNSSGGKRNTLSEGDSNSGDTEGGPDDSGDTEESGEEERPYHLEDEREGFWDEGSDDVLAG